MPPEQGVFVPLTIQHRQNGKTFQMWKILLIICGKCFYRWEKRKTEKGWEGVRERGKKVSFFSEIKHIVCSVLFLALSLSPLKNLKKLIKKPKKNKKNDKNPLKNKRFWCGGSEKGRQYMQELEALKESELNCMQSMAEGILDSIATIKAGLKSLQGFMLRINNDNNIEIVKGIKFNYEV